MMKLRLFEVIGLAVMLALTVFAGVSCSKVQASSQELSGVTWELKSYGDPDNLKQAIADNEPTISFDKDKKQVSGNTGVNGYGGDYTTDGNKITIKDVVQTLMASEDPAVNEQETAYMRILNSAETFEISGGQLTITGTEGILVFEKR